MEKKESMAGMSLKGGRRDRFFFCLLEYYPDSKRFFLSSLLQVKDEESLDGNDAIRAWINKFDPKTLIVDCPLSSPPCATCVLDCPGIASCPVKNVVDVKNKIKEILDHDMNIWREGPKQYEEDRNQEKIFDYSKNILDRNPTEYIITKSFKRRLKKGFLPYWNRPLDFWIWMNYYDALLEVFNVSYDSFGNTSLMLLSRFSYLRRHFPSSMKVHESNINLSLIELIKAKLITKKDIEQLIGLESGLYARINIIRAIEKNLNLFIYDNDLEILSKNPRAFESFILALSGMRAHLGHGREVPAWAESGADFLIPIF